MNVVNERIKFCSVSAAAAQCSSVRNRACGTVLNAGPGPAMPVGTGILMGAAGGREGNGAGMTAAGDRVFVAAGMTAGSSGAACVWLNGSFTTTLESIL